MNSKITNRIPSLDGLRAISILMVVFGHAFHIKFLDIANLGVRIFFVISAYLIVGILLRDVEKNRFSIITFYFKRFARIFPAFYVFLGILCLVLVTLNLFDWDQFWRAPLFLENYHPRSLWNTNQWFVGHTWSLAVEEQFYIIVALLFLLFSKDLLTKNKLLYIFIAIVVGAPLIRVCYLYFTCIPDFLRGSIHRSFETVADSLAVGGIIAIIPFQKFEEQMFFKYFKNRIVIILLIILLIQLLNSSWVVADFGLKPRYFYNFIGLTIINSCIGLIVVILINYPNNSTMTKFLNHQFMITIGLWSYSIYLWQQVWLYSWDLPLIVKFGGIVGCAAGSYYWIEKPFLRWRDAILNKNETN